MKIAALYHGSNSSSGVYQVYQSRCRRQLSRRFYRHRHRRKRCCGSKYDKFKLPNVCDEMPSSSVNYLTVRRCIAWMPQLLVPPQRIQLPPLRQCSGGQVTSRRPHLSHDHIAP